MSNPFKAKTPEHFFWTSAGYSHDPKTETAKQGRKRCAKELAWAEERGSDAGFSFQWEQDDQTDESFRDTDEPYFLWACVCRDLAGKVLASLGGVDFGAPPAEPWSNTY